MWKKKKQKGEEQCRGKALSKKTPFIIHMEGNRELNVENYGVLGDFNSEKIVLHCYKYKLVVEGKGLSIEYFTDVDLKIIGRIQEVHVL